MESPSLKCPKCGQSDLVTRNRDDVEVDLCPSCHGVWLDRGELDALIAHALAPRPSAREWEDDEVRYDREYPARAASGREERSTARQSWLSDVLD